MRDLERAVGIVAEEMAQWTDPRDGIRQGLLAAIAAGVLTEARCSCPVGFGQVADPACARHGRREPAHTITGLVR